MIEITTIINNKPQKVYYTKEMYNQLVEFDKKREVEFGNWLFNIK